MKTNITNTNMLLKSAFLTAPVLITASALSFVFGITIIPPGITGYVEGVLGCFALMLFVPVYLYLGNLLAMQRPLFGRITIVAGLAGAVTGYGMELLRVTEYSLRMHGAGDAIWANWYANMGMEYIGVAIFGPLFPITSILLGIGFFVSKQFPKWICAALMAAGIGFPLAQVLELDWALKITYPLACILWIVALWGIAFRHFHTTQNQ